MPPKPQDPALVELVETSPRPMALYDAGGRLLAASAGARDDAARLGYSIGRLDDLDRLASRFLTSTTLQSGKYTLVTLTPQPAIRGGEARLSSILDACPGAVIVMDFDGRVMQLNPAAECMFGYSFEELVGRVLPIVPAEEMPAFERSRDMVRSGGSLSSIPLRRRTKDGRMLDLRLSAAPARDADGRVVAAVAVYEDVTELNETVRNLERSRAHLSHAMQLASMGSFVLEFTGNSLMWSPEAYRIHGTDPETFHPTRPAVAAMIHPEDLPRVAAAMERAQRTGENFSSDYRMTRPDGELRHFRISAEPVKDESGKVVKLFGIVQDVTDYKQLQEQFLQAQKLETVGLLAGGVAHDFNNLLTIINGHSELLLMKSPRDAAERDSLMAIHEAGVRAASLTRQLLTLGRKQQYEPRRIDLNRIVEECVRVIRQLIGEDVQLEIELAEAPLHVKADPGQIHQVLLNLAVNAREAMPRGGRLAIRCGRLESSPPYLPAGQPSAGEWAEFSVADTGLGMDERACRRIFEPFFTTKDQSKHSGLGLSTVYGVLRQHGGGIGVESAPGQGSTFRSALPLDASPAVEEPPAPALAEKAAGASVVVVEDQPAVRSVISAILGSFGYDVVEFASPEAAISHFESGEAVDLLVTDVIMPGLHGTEVARRARELRPGMPVLFISGYAEPNGEAALVHDDITGFLAKPFHPHELAALAAKLLAR